MLITQNLNLQLGHKQLCQQLSTTFKAGELWCLLGPNGSGKTTLLHTLAGLHKPNGGLITLQGQPLTQLSPKKRAKQLGILLQQDQGLALATVYEALLAARHPHQNYWQSTSATDHQLLTNIMKQLELTKLQNQQVIELSGGERQRVHIGMLLAQNPDVLLLDEPTNHLDLKHQWLVLKLLRQLAHQEKKLIIMALHDINLAYEFSTHACLLYPGGIAQTGKTLDIFDEKSLGLLYNLELRKIKSESQSWWRSNSD